MASVVPENYTNKRPVKTAPNRRSRSAEVRSLLPSFDNEPEGVDKTMISIVQRSLTWSHKKIFEVLLESMPFVFFLVK